MPAPNLLSVTVNDGQVPTVQMFVFGQGNVLTPIPVAGQQSTVHNLKLKFDLQVTIEPGAITLVPHAGVVVRGPLQPNQLAVECEFDAIPGGSGLTWCVTFDGPGADPVSGVLKPGVYDLVIDPAKIKSSGTPMASAPAPFVFWAMFGGVQIGVGTALAFNIANTASMDGKFGAKAGDANYSPAYDGNLDGNVDGIDRVLAEQAIGTVWVF